MFFGKMIRLDIRADPALWQGQFDVLEVWRSKMTADGPFEELTASSYMPARLPAAGGDKPMLPEQGPLVRLSGVSLELLVDEAVPLSIPFNYSVPISTMSAAGQIAFASQGKVQAWSAFGRLVMETIRMGLGASLRVVGGDAAPILRLATDEPLSISSGRDVRLALVPGTEQYSFIDPHGDDAFIYKTRFRNTRTGVVSGLSAPITSNVGVSPQNVVRGYVRLSDMSGKPLPSWRILVDTTSKVTSADGFVMAGPPVSALTDTNGYAEVELVRGLAVTVSIVGTSLFRDIVVPTDPTIQAFNLLDPNLGKDDLFSVQVPAMEFAARRSLGG